MFLKACVGDILTRLQAVINQYGKGAPVQIFFFSFLVTDAANSDRVLLTQLELLKYPLQ